MQMQDREAQSETGSGAKFSPTLRDLVAPVFRRRRLVAISFVAIFLCAIVAASLLPAEYQAQMKILVKRERADPMATPDQPALAQSASELTEEELNSEVELLKGRDLLEKVAVTCGLPPSGAEPIWARVLRSLEADATASGSGREREVSLAVRALEKKLRVETIKKTNLIQATYESPDPRFAARVLNVLAGLYLEKHLAVHRPSGALEFFHQETERYREQLTSAERREGDASRGEGVVSASLEKEIAVRKLADFDAELRVTQTAIVEARKRIQDLESQLAGTLARRITQIRTSPNSALLQELKSTLLNLELKRTDLLEKFDPSYRLVREAEQQIAQARAAIEAAERAPLHEDTTDPDPTHDWLRAETAKSRAELAALEARAAATAGVVRAYREKAQRLEQQGTVQEDLTRDVKVAEGNYLLYLRKEEEARISDALDRRRILNVAVAEAATVPLLPSRSPMLPTLLLGWLLASFVSFGLAFVADYLDPCLRTPGELRALLDLPVLAAVPKEVLVARPAWPVGAARTAAVTAIVAGLCLYSAGRGFTERDSIRSASGAMTAAPPAGAAAERAGSAVPASDVPTKLVLVSEVAEGSGKVGVSALAEPVARALAVVGPGQTLREICLRYLGRFDSQLVSEVEALNPQLQNPEDVRSGEWVWLPWRYPTSRPTAAMGHGQ
jgi:uncharacterized protein involved in exopolysaccharide biosynthesis